MTQRKRLGISCYGVPRDLHSLDLSHSHCHLGVLGGHPKFSAQIQDKDLALC